MHRADFCVAGIIRDIFLFNNYKKIKSLTVLVFLSMFLFEIARLLGILPLYPFPLLGTPSLGNAIGGFVFGVGMVLTGGCVIGVLYKIGSGSLLAFIGLMGIFFGSVLYAEIHDNWVLVLKATTITKESLLTKWIGISPFIAVLIFGSIGFYLILKWYKNNDFKVNYMPKGYISLLKAAIFLSLLSALSYLFIGMPFGITTSYAKFGGFIESILFPEHFQKLSYFKLKTLDYIYPLTNNKITGGPAPVFDGIVAIQVPVIMGIVIGSFVSALTLKEFKIYLKIPIRQMVSALVGGILLGISSRLAQGCNIWHIFGGLPIFALQSILFTIFIFPGAWFGTKLLTRYVIK
ncbi:MAG: YeeE/YedE family protein [Thermodesulfovibrionales bacterium]|nr:YeeE/YedE family protein [Thermodesulfovibrionales bacterium]